MGQPYRDELKDQEQNEDFLGKVKKAYKAFRS
jgi:hypothetical protein